MARQGTMALRRTIRRHQLHEMVPLADSTIYEMEQRGEFPRRFANVALSPEKPVPAVLLAPVRRGLALSIDTGRVSAAGN